MGRRSVSFAIAFACVLVLAGCGSPTEANDTTPPTEPRPTTAPSTAADTPALVVTEQAAIAADPDSGSVSPDSSVTLIKNVTLVEGRDANGDGGSEALALRIRADTSVPTADGTGDPGDPYFTVAINGAQEFTTAEVERMTDGTFTVPVDASQLPAGQGQLRIRIQLVDEDIAFNDEIATRTVRVEYPPARTQTWTSTATGTDVSTPMSAPRPSATSVSAAMGDIEAVTSAEITRSEVQQATVLLPQLI